MSVDMTKWCELAKQNINNRQNVGGRLGGKTVIVTGAAQGFGKGIAEMVGKTVETFGGIDLLVANAGVVRSGPPAHKGASPQKSLENPSIKAIFSPYATPKLQHLIPAHPFV